MSEFLYFILFITGLLMVIKGSEWFIDAAVWGAEVFRVPPLIIGATIISICTTMPETFVSAAAAAMGEPVMALGNALGSIGVNSGLILAVLWIFTRPVIDNRIAFLQNSGFLLFLLLLLIAAGLLFQQVSRLIGAILLILFILYIIHNFRAAKKIINFDIQYDIVDDHMIRGDLDTHNSQPEGTIYDEHENDFDISAQTLTKKIVFFALGIGLVLLGSNLLVESGIRIAEIFHVPAVMIAVVFTSIGTSLPELITVIASIRKKASNLGLGNILGASILNIVQAVGISAIISPIPMSGEKSLLIFQLPFLALMILSVLFLGMSGRERLPKWGGYWLLALYFVYLSANLLREKMPLLGPLVFGA
ncbi:MAG: sodium:proton exchanger [Bacillota bacterium]|nr:sodium:proton exchanger [Bacillota bacterium]